MSNLLNEEGLRKAVDWLAARDADLAQIVDRYGSPPLWGRPPGFPTLVYIILEQQVSLASAKAAYDRLLNLASPLTPERFLQFDDATLKAIGFSRQKSHYCRLLAQSILTGAIDLALLETLPDAEVYSRLTALKGIGAWTANIYLLMVLLRPDIWPGSDLALIVAMQRVKQLPTRPTPAETEVIAEAWRPYRAVAARLLWFEYLGGKQ